MDFFTPEFKVFSEQTCVYVHIMCLETAHDLSEYSTWIWHRAPSRPQFHSLTRGDYSSKHSTADLCKFILQQFLFEQMQVGILQVDSSLSVRFPIPNSQLYLDPLSVCLSTDVRIIEANGKKLTESYMLFIICNILHSMINRVEVW